MLKELKFVQGSIAKKDFLPALTHFKIQDGRVRGFNGVIALSSPIQLDIDCLPKADQLIRAIQQCDETVQILMTTAGRLSIRSGKFKAFVECIEKTDTPHVEPTGEMFDLNGKALVDALEAVSPFIGDDASRPWSNGVLLRGASAFATNNVVLVEYWFGTQLPFECCIPRAAVKEILRIGEPPTHGQIDQNSITFHYADSRWIRTQLLSTEWPDLAKVLDQPNEATKLEPDLFRALEKIKPFADKIGRVYFQSGIISTHEDTNEGANVEVFGVRAGPVFNIEMLALLESVAERIDFNCYPKPCAFYGGRLRGAIVGMRNSQ